MLSSQESLLPLPVAPPAVAGSVNAPPRNGGGGPRRAPGPAWRRVRGRGSAAMRRLGVLPPLLLWLCSPLPLLAMPTPGTFQRLSGVGGGGGGCSSPAGVLNVSCCLARKTGRLASPLPPGAYWRG